MLLFEQIVLGGKGNKLLNNLTAELHLKLSMSIQLGTPTGATASFMFTNFEKGFLLYHAYKIICVNTKSTAFTKRIDSDICAKCLQLCFGSESREELPPTTTKTSAEGTFVREVLKKDLVFYYPKEEKRPFFVVFYYDRVRTPLPPPFVVR